MCIRDSLPHAAQDRLHAHLVMGVVHDAHDRPVGRVVALHTPRDGDERQAPRDCFVVNPQHLRNRNRREGVCGVETSEGGKVQGELTARSTDVYKRQLSPLTIDS